MAAKTIVKFDGGSQGNPGKRGSGWLVEEDGEVVAAGSIFGGHGTNNVAEYDGCIAGLQAAVERGATRVTLMGDSMLVLRQVQRKWRVNAPHLEPLRDAACALVAKIPMGVEFEHLPAHLNFMADALANVAMEEETSRTGLELIVEAEQWMQDNQTKVKKGPRKRSRKRSAPKEAAAAAPKKNRAE